MRKFFTTVLFLTMAVLAYFGYAHYSGAALPVWGLPIGGQKALIRSRVTEFFESVRFKNTQHLKDLVAPTIQADEIAHYLRQTLGYSSNEIDLHSVKIKDIELDSLHQRARVRVELSGQNLTEQKPLDITKIIFLYREENSIDNNSWLIDIKNFSI